ncbi:proline--tRNA ligase [Planosporangium thailandense]|uniref:Proline--tRNA ligase n=1 Tax=Planosporangium thailandense TaxID=765197 RepID=A0ABX0XS20_9ACTN|nr:proline--tRNA ligase [Planosporangium thailandense]NJC68804.1 proline--tRNA ligase [Planosporangium thailandense]
MLLRLSNLFVRTLREDPAEAEVPSHRLLVRAGYVRRVAPGGYAWLPLGKLVLDRVAAIVREEMNAIGAQEVSFPSLLPQERYEATGRLRDYGPDLFRLKDRRGAGYVLGPTHEELFTLLVKDLYASYRDYPVTLYQIGTKFRDEARPRGGLLRGREFLMKDAYSFDLDDEGLRRAYAAQREAYIRVFDRLGLDYTIVAAMAGAMGGSASEEFLAPSPAGEDTYVACTACDYAANTEAVATPAPPAATDVEHPASTVFDTPGTPTIDSLVEYANSVATGGRTDWTAADTLKNVVLQVGDEPLVIGLPGDRDVDLKRVEAALYPATGELFDDFSSYPDLVRGYIGPQVLAKLGIRYLVDPRVVPATAWVTGANEQGKHAINVVCGRDFVPDGTIEAAEVRAGDPCPNCAAPLEIRRGIEVGHIFQLGRRFADAFGLDALGPDGQPVRVTMGSYGIGVSRVVAAIVEQHHDERGLNWPVSVAPCQVHVIATGKGEQAETASRLASELTSRGIDVLLDDRPGLSAGVRFADAELLGMPVVVVVGRRLAEGYVELRSRIDGSRSDVPVGGVVDLISAQLAG